MNTAPQSQPEDGPLLAEGEFLHRKLFGFEAPPEILTRYVGFVATLEDSVRQQRLDSLMVADLDVEAIEYALRYRQRHHPLHQKIHGLCFLCEAHPRYWNYFYSDGANCILAWLRLALAGVRSGWLLLKGNYLIYRHHLV